MPQVNISNLYKKVKAFYNIILLKFYRIFFDFPKYIVLKFNIIDFQLSGTIFSTYWKKVFTLYRNSVNTVYPPYLILEHHLTQ